MEPASFNGGLTLGVVEVGGDTDDGVGNLPSEVGLSGLLILVKTMAKTSRE